MMISSSDEQMLRRLVRSIIKVWPLTLVPPPDVSRVEETLAESIAYDIHPALKI